MTKVDIKEYKDLKELARRQADDFVGGKSRCVGLSGPLGVGKTALTNEIAGCLGCNEVVTSPTFTLAHRYTTEDGKIFLHADLYRIDPHDRETVEMFKDAMREADFVMLEWVDRVPELKKLCDTLCEMRFEGSDRARSITIVPHMSLRGSRHTAGDEAISYSKNYRPSNSDARRGLKDKKQKLILRIEVTKAGRTAAWLYDDNAELALFEGDSIKEVSNDLDRTLGGKWSTIKTVLAFRGPAGFSRLRASHAFALGLGRGLNIPVTGYDKWGTSLLRQGSSLDHPQDIIPIYEDKSKAVISS